MYRLTLFLIFIFQLSFSQDRVLIQGKVIYRNIDVPAANVVNNTAQTTTITNDNGEFQILAKVDDEIIFSSVQYIIRTVRVNEEIIRNKRLVVQINQRVRELDEVVVTPDDTDKFLDLKEEQFKGFDYLADKSTRIQNILTDDRQVVNGLNFVNIFRLLSTLIDSKSEEEKINISPSEVLPFILEENFFKDVLNLETFHLEDFLSKLDRDENLKTLILEKNQFLIIDYLLQEANNYLEKISE
ncbi:MAG: carboxypeptidase-like regulatory domain-containing protein [Bacteroidota bacterium]